MVKKLFIILFIGSIFINFGYAQAPSCFRENPVKIMKNSNFKTYFYIAAKCWNPKTEKMVAVFGGFFQATGVTAQYYNPSSYGHFGYYWQKKFKAAITEKYPHLKFSSGYYNGVTTGGRNPSSLYCYDLDCLKETRAAWIKFYQERTNDNEYIIYDTFTIDVDVENRPNTFKSLRITKVN